MEKIKPLYEERKAREEECTRELALKEQKRKELYAKQGRGSHFKSKEDRDRWIQGELKSLNKQIKDKKDHKDKLEADLKRDALKTVELQKKIEEQSQELERQKNYIDDYNKQCYELKKNKDQFQATRKYGYVQCYILKFTEFGFLASYGAKKTMCKPIYLRLKTISRKQTSNYGLW